MSGVHQTLRHSIDCRGVSLDWGEEARALVMGILNVTPDSFSDGGLFVDLSAAVDRAGVMIEEGADIIDIGGESSRPAGSAYGAGARVVPAEEEMARVVPVIEAVVRNFPGAVVSVDTYKSQVARAAVGAGARIVNDITGFRGDVEMPGTVAEAGVPIVLMHSVGSPGKMPHELSRRDVVAEVKDWLLRAVAAAEAHGITDIIVDPGFGFGKSVADNMRLIAELSALCELGRPILVGVSRKASIGATLEPDGDSRPVGDRLHGSLAAASAAIQNGASIIRTHDVKATRDVATVLHALRSSSRVRQEVAV
ncbi:MAG: dihydropteroate synthase [Rhodothermia bacterium]